MELLLLLPLTLSAAALYYLFKPPADSGDADPGRLHLPEPVPGIVLEHETGPAVVSLHAASIARPAAADTQGRGN